MGKSPWKSLTLRWNIPFCSHPLLPGEQGHFSKRHLHFQQTQFLLPHWCGRCPYACTCTGSSPPAGKWGQIPLQQSHLEERDQLNVLSVIKYQQYLTARHHNLNYVTGKSPCLISCLPVAATRVRTESDASKTKMQYRYCRNAGQSLTILAWFGWSHSS